MKSCKNCNECERLYIKCYYCFIKRKVFFCIKDEKIISPEHCCENWKKKKPVYDLSPKRFDEIEEDVKKIAEYKKTLSSSD